MRIDVPDMKDETAVRIAVNAAEYELARNDANFSVDLKTGTVSHTGNAALKSAAVQAKIESALQDVGLNGKVVSVQATPTEAWRDRHTASIRIKKAGNVLIFNIAVHAIAHAMRGNNESVAVDRENRSLTVKYDSLGKSLKNIEHAIASAGLQANDVPASLASGAALPYGWR